VNKKNWGYQKRGRTEEGWKRCTANVNKKNWGYEKRGRTEEGWKRCTAAKAGSWERAQEQGVKMYEKAGVNMRVKIIIAVWQKS
jgi:hypothetical protein